MSKYAETMFKYFIELCETRGIRYIMFRDKSTSSSMYIFDIDTGKYNIENNGVSLSNVWMCNLNPYLDQKTTMVKYYKIELSDDSHLNFLDRAIHLYDEIVDRNELLKGDRDHSYIYIPHKTDFVITEWKDLEDPLIYFQPCYHLFDGVDIRFNKTKTSLFLFYLIIGRYGCGMFFENLEDYLKWRIPVEKYILEHTVNNLPSILWRDELGFLLPEYFN